MYKLKKFNGVNKSNKTYYLLNIINLGIEWNQYFYKTSAQNLVKFLKFKKIKK